MGLKKIKKYYKEKQLEVYISKKQNEFALKTQKLSKIELLINAKNTKTV